ncbi:SAM-dependent methyltransferase, partial [Streptomyces geysiriensis]|nr:SAM-dependent methyltransferase [Streptomyces geysiriensis]
MLDYDKEAEVYDASRGGEPRAEAAARAVLSLVPPRARELLDVACGTGIYVVMDAPPTGRITRFLNV